MGWRGCHYERDQITGIVQGTAEFDDEGAGGLHEAAHYAFVNRLPFDVPNWPGVIIVDVDVTFELREIDATVFGSSSSTFLAGEKRIVTRIRWYAP